MYLDNSATTKIHPEVLEAMKSYLEDEYANPESPYSFARGPDEAIDKARKRIAICLSCEPEEIYFTSGGAEADSWAIKGFILENNGFIAPNVVTSSIEHHAILNACRDLEKYKLANVTYVAPDKSGIVLAKDVESNISRGTKLVSIMFANNELGTINQIEDIANICKKKRVTLHTDAVQIFGKWPIHVDKIGIDMLSASGHKIGAPKGVGFLYIRNGIKIAPLINGGMQENGLRGGTHNVAGIVGLGKAVEIAMRTSPSDKLNEVKKLKYAFYAGLLSKYPDIGINGNAILALPSIINIRFSAYNIKAEELLAFLDANKIFVSSGSACNTKENKPSHVLKAIGLSDEEASSSIRFSFGEENSMKDVEELIKVIDQGIKLLQNR